MQDPVRAGKGNDPGSGGLPVRIPHEQGSNDGARHGCYTSVKRGCLTPKCGACIIRLLLYIGTAFFYSFLSS